MTTEIAANTPENGGVSNVCMSKSGRIEAEKDGPSGATNTIRGLTITPTAKETAMALPIVPTFDSIDERMFTLEYLELARRDYERARDRRIYFIGLARRYGLQWTEIGPALGITDTAAARLYRRAMRRGR